MSIDPSMSRFSKYSTLAGKAVRYLKESGPGPLLATARRTARERRAYQEWVRKYGTVTDGQRREYLSRIDGFKDKPLISVVLPVYNVDENLLRKCIDSVTGQIYPGWELCIADDASTKPHIRRVLEEYKEADGRIKVVYREVNGHISAASNSALELAEGAFTVLLDHDDELSEDALFWVANELNEHPETMMIYSDEDLIDEAGRRSEPKFKPDFSRDLFYSINLVTHLSAYRTALLQKIGGFRVGFEGSQDYDLALRVIEQITEGRIRHIPRILYHWRITPGSLASDLEAKPYAHESARRAIGDHLERMGKKAEVVETGYLHRVRYTLPDDPPKVAVVVHTSTANDLIEKLRRSTEYLNFEAAAAGDDGEPTAASLNRAVSAAAGEIICFVNGSLEPLGSDWLSELVSFAMQDGIGVVGAKLLYPNNTVAGSGLVLGAGGITETAHKGFLRTVPGNISRNRLICNYSAVSVECLMIRRDVFDEAGGFDEENLPRSLFDADLCLRVRQKGRRVVVTPFAELRWTQWKDVLVPAAEEIRFFENRWPGIIENDPFYNPNLSKKRADFSIDI